MKFDKNFLRLYAVTDRNWVGKQSFTQQVEAALKGGCTCLQLREKELDDTEFLAEAFNIKALCQKYKVPFVINDNVDIAIKVGADGIHVGQDDMKALNIRKKVGDTMFLGVSVQTVEEAIEAEKNGADYIGVGAFFPTDTKTVTNLVSIHTLNKISKSVKLPIVAIGGISRTNIKELSGNNIDGIAVVSAIFAQEDIEKECRKLLALSNDMVNESRRNNF
ncbi:MAG: thiamine phosphate synthase [Filifactoraceae bacterium]